jgi:hypothetical protein
MIARFAGMLLVLALIVLPLVAQDATIPALDAVTPVEISATSTPEPSATLAVATATATASLTALPSSTVELAPVLETATPTNTDVAEVTASVTADSLPTNVIVVTGITTTPTLIATVTATDALSTPAVVLVQGSAVYQQHVTDDHSGILIEVFSAERYLLSSAYTDSLGQYALAVPNEPYWLVASAAGHQEIAGVVQTGALPPAIVLPGGDLDADGCITTTDMDMLLDHLNGAVLIANADLNQDGAATIADLAILTGNIKPLCEIFVRIHATPAVPTLSDADALTLTPVSTPAPTEVIVTDAGVPATTDITPIDAPLVVTISPTVLPSPAFEVSVTSIVPDQTLPASTPTATPSFEAPPEAGVITTEDQEE